MRRQNETLGWDMGEEPPLQAVAEQFSVHLNARLRVHSEAYIALSEQAFWTASVQCFSPNETPSQRALAHRLPVSTTRSQCHEPFSKTRALHRFEHVHMLLHMQHF